jgi:hypothetical protein
LQSLADDLLGFTNVNPLAMLTLLNDTCAITKMIWRQLRQAQPSWDPNSPIETVSPQLLAKAVRNRRWRSDLGCHRHSRSPQDLREIWCL